MNSITQLMRSYNLSSTESTNKYIARIMLKNIHSIKDMTIEDIALLTSYSPATISRYIRSIGFKNFNQFQSNLTEAFASYYSRERMLPSSMYVPSSNTSNITAFQDAMKEILDRFVASINVDNIHNIVDDMHNAKKICYYSHMAQDTHAKNLQYNLIISGKETFFSSEYSEQLKESRSLDKESFVIFCIPNNSEASKRISLTNNALISGAKSLLISPSSNFVGRNLNYLLTFEETRSLLDNYIMSYYVSLIDMVYRQKFLES